MTFQLSTSLDDDTKNVVKSPDHTFTQVLTPSVQVPYFAKPQVALWSLSFANTFANIDPVVFKNDRLILNYRHIERIQEEYQQLEDELQPFIETVQSQIEKLETMSTCCEQVHAATSPNMVDAIAAAELPSMSSGSSGSFDQ